MDPPDSGVQPRVSPTVEFHTVPADCSGQLSKRQCLGVCPVAHVMSPVNVWSSLWTPEETVWKNERKQSPRPNRTRRQRCPRARSLCRNTRLKPPTDPACGPFCYQRTCCFHVRSSSFIEPWRGDGVRRNETPRQGLCAVFSFHLSRFALWPSPAVLGVAGRSLPSVLGGCGMWLR